MKNLKQILLVEDDPKDIELIHAALAEHKLENEMVVAIAGSAGVLAAHLHLTWRYAEPSATAETPLIPPPPEELERASQYANEGRILDIQTQAAPLETLDEAYLPFARRLKQLAKTFDIDQIKELIKPFMEADKDEQE
jgi:CheY-like chemotaxis protein